MTGRNHGVEVRDSDQGLEARWEHAGGTQVLRFDHLPGTSPAYLASAADLDDLADRRAANDILDAVAAWARARGAEAGLWHDDDGIEFIT